MCIVYYTILYSDVKLPGKSRDKPASFNFGTPYINMYDQLANDDKEVLLLSNNTIL